MTWYKSDSLGLKTLNDEGRVIEVSLNEKHADFTSEDVDKIFIPFLTK